MSEQDDTYLTKSQFAKRQGWSRSYVSKLSGQGKLIRCPGNPKLIDVAASLTALGRSFEPGAPSGDGAIVASPDPNYWSHKTRHEAALAKLSEMELAKKAGELVDAKRVEEAAFASGRMLRDAVLGLPTRLAPELAAMTDAFQIEVRMRNELRQILADMAKMTVADLSRVIGETSPTRMAKTEGDERNALRR